MEQMEIFTYRKSMKETGKCPKCGTKIIGSDGYPTKHAMMSERPDDNRLWCGKCFRNGIAFQVGTVNHMDVDAMQEESDQETIKFLSSQIDLLNRKIKRLEDTISFNQTTTEMIKKNNMEVLASKNQMIQDLQKENLKLEHRLDEILKKLQINL